MRAARESRNARRRLCAQIRERTRTKPFEPRSTALALCTLMTVPRIHNHPGSTRIGLPPRVILAPRIQHHALVIGHSLSISVIATAVLTQTLSL